MSDNRILFVPKDPDHVPHAGAVQAALSLINELMPEAERTETLEHATVQLFDCGGNLERVSCPDCRSEIDFDWWGEAMSADFDDKAGFRLAEHTLPCCAAPARLNRLDYYFHMAFGRFALQVMNPDCGLVSEGQITRVAQALECEISVVYQHI